MIMNNKKPLVTICCMVYNHEDYIKQAFDGFLIQKTNFDFEIIVHDDASTDNSKNIIEDFAKKDSRFKPIFQKSNKYSKGERITFKYLFPKCNSKYIAICDGDDYWTDPLKLQKQVDFLENNLDYSIVGAKLHNLDQKAGVVSDWEHEKNKILNADIRNLIDGNFIYTSSSLFINDFKIEPWWQDFPIGDWPFFILQIKDRKIKILDEFMGVYRVHNKGIFSKISLIKQLQTELNCLEILLKEGPFSKDTIESLEKNIADKKLSIAIEKSPEVKSRETSLKQEIDFLNQQLKRIKKSLFYKTFVKLELFLRNIKKIKP